MGVQVLEALGIPAWKCGVWDYNSLRFRVWATEDAFVLLFICIALGDCGKISEPPRLVACLVAVVPAQPP